MTTELIEKLRTCATRPGIGTRTRNGALLEAAKEIERLRDALQELVTLKEMKDRGLDYDDRIEYMDRKPKAWAAAKALLTPNAAVKPRRCED